VTDSPRIFRTGFEAMRTRFELVLSVEKGLDAEAAAEEARAEVEACEERLSLFKPGSRVSALNRSPLTPVRLDPATFDLLAQAQRIHHASGGAFDPTIGPLMAFWGFRGDAPAAGPAGPARGMASLRLDSKACAACLACPAEVGQLDLGAIAKGHALDLAAARLRELGVRTALLHGGTSSVLAMGAPPGTPGWKLAIEPPSGGTHRRVIVTLRDAALGVSASHGRTIRGSDRTTLGHVMDPRTGHPANGGLLAAAVCVDAAGADAWSTAMLVAPDDALAWASPELLGRLVVMRDGVVRSAVAASGSSPGAEAGLPWCTLEVGA
jgi:thiamine biosynthesis lipoprotein